MEALVQATDQEALRLMLEKLVEESLEAVQAKVTKEAMGLVLDLQDKYLRIWDYREEQRLLAFSKDQWMAADSGVGPKIPQEETTGLLDPFDECPMARSLSEDLEWVGPTWDGLLHTQSAWKTAAGSVIPDSGYLHGDN